MRWRGSTARLFGRGTRVRRRPSVGPLDLLVLQPTPFCNIDCSYCYLHNRTDSRRMSLDVLRRTLERVVESSLVGDCFTLVWHAGEPLAAGVDFYESATRIVNEIVPGTVEVQHSVQTNGMLIDQSWCDLWTEHRFAVGVSIDGPAKIHDLHRRTRSGKGTHALTERGIDRLKARGLSFHTISVLTKPAIEQPRRLFEYFKTLAPERCCFNVEEAEGSNRVSSLGGTESNARVVAFFREFLELNAGSGFPLSVRELDGARSVILNWRASAAHEMTAMSQELNPFRIITVDVDGNFTTFSPELIDAVHRADRPFVLGNVRDSGFDEATRGQRYRALSRSIRAGVDRCRATCSYFPFCGGGSPSNKYFEHGTFECTETDYCRNHKQAPLDAVLGFMESQIAKAECA